MSLNVFERNVCKVLQNVVFSKTKTFKISNLADRLTMRPIPIEAMDEYQQSAVDADTARPLIIQAGPGSGKTTTLINRIIRVREAHPSAPFLVLTFSKNATEEVQNRVKAKCGTHVGFLNISTYHAFSFRIIREHFEVLGYKKRPVVLDHKAFRKLVMDAMGQLPSWGTVLYNNPASKRELAETIRVLKRAARQPLPVDSLTQQDIDGNPHRSLVELYNKYIVLMKSSGYIGFHDMLPLAVQVLQRSSEVLAAEREKAAFIFCDEFQDTNRLQLQLVTLLGKNSKMTVVGDKHQMIFRFQGATDDSFDCLAASLEQQLLFAQKQLLHQPQLQPQQPLCDSSISTKCNASTAILSGTDSSSLVQYVSLRVNYRSTFPIITASNALMGAAMLPPATATTATATRPLAAATINENTADEDSVDSSIAINACEWPVQLCEFNSRLAQNSYVFQLIQQLLSGAIDKADMLSAPAPLTGSSTSTSIASSEISSVRTSSLRPCDIAVLYRKNKDGAAFHEYLTERLNAAELGYTSMCSAGAGTGISAADVNSQNITSSSGAQKRRVGVTFNAEGKEEDIDVDVEEENYFLLQQQLISGEVTDSNTKAQNVAGLLLDDAHLLSTQGLYSTFADVEESLGVRGGMDTRININPPEANERSQNDFTVDSTNSSSISGIGSSSGTLEEVNPIVNESPVFCAFIASLKLTLNIEDNVACFASLKWRFLSTTNKEKETNSSSSSSSTRSGHTGDARISGASTNFSKLHLHEEDHLFLHSAMKLFLKFRELYRTPQNGSENEAGLSRPPIATAAASALSRGKGNSPNKRHFLQQQHHSHEQSSPNSPLFRVSSIPDRISLFTVLEALCIGTLRGDETKEQLVTWWSEVKWGQRGSVDSHCADDDDVRSLDIIAPGNHHGTSDQGRNEMENNGMNMSLLLPSSASSVRKRKSLSFAPCSAAKSQNRRGGGGKRRGSSGGGSRHEHECGGVVVTKTMRNWINSVRAVYDEVQQSALTVSKLCDKVVSPMIMGIRPTGGGGAAATDTSGLKEKLLNDHLFDLYQVPEAELLPTIQCILSIFEDTHQYPYCGTGGGGGGGSWRQSSTLFAGKWGKQLQLIDVAQLFIDHLTTKSAVGSEIDDHTSQSQRPPPVTVEDRIWLSTIHKAKGREWPVVILIDADDRTFGGDAAALLAETSSSSPPLDPNGSASDSDSSRLDSSIKQCFEDERKVLYVAATRASRFLCMSFVGTGRENTSGSASRWLKPLMNTAMKAAKQQTQQQHQQQQNISSVVGATKLDSSCSCTTTGNIRNRSVSSKSQPSSYVWYRYMPELHTGSGSDRSEPHSERRRAANATEKVEAETVTNVAVWKRQQQQQQQQQQAGRYTHHPSVSLASSTSSSSSCAAPAVPGILPPLSQALHKTTDAAAAAATTTTTVSSFTTVDPWLGPFPGDADYISPTTTPSAPNQNYFRENDPLLGPLPGDLPIAGREFAPSSLQVNLHSRGYSKAVEVVLLPETDPWLGPFPGDA